MLGSDVPDSTEIRLFAQLASRLRLDFGSIAAATLLALGCQAAEPPAEPEPVAPRSADHHLHIQTETAAQNLDQLRNALEGEDPERKPSHAHTAADVIVALDRAGLEGGALLSVAYMFGFPDIEVDDELNKVQAENDYIAAQAALYPDRLVGLCSVNPLRDYALAEVERCARDSRLSGLKLHLANSDVDLLDPAQIDTLAALFRRLAELDLPALVHMRTRNPQYGQQDTAAFIDGVLAQAPELHVQIAHMAGWGGYDDATDAALAEFARAFEDGRLDPSRYTFGLAATVFSPAAAGDDEERAEQVRSANQRLAARIREIGTDRVLFATDWPAWPPVDDASTGIERNIELIRSALPLTEAELDEIMGNVSELFD